MAETLIGYARCMRDEADLAAQRRELSSLGVDDEHMHFDTGLIGNERERRGLNQALAAVRPGETFVVPKLVRLAESIRDARDIVSGLFDRGVRLSLGGSVYDFAEPSGKQLSHALFLLAEFDVDLMRLRTNEGMVNARAQGKLRGRRPKLSPAQRLDLLRLYEAGGRTIADLAETFSVSRATVYRILKSGPKAADEPSEVPKAVTTQAGQADQVPESEAPTEALALPWLQIPGPPLEPRTDVISLPWLQEPWREVLRTLDEELAFGRISALAYRACVNRLLEIQDVVSARPEATQPM